MIRILTVNDLNEMKKLRLKKNTHAGVQIQKLTSRLILNIDRKYFNEPHLAVGYFEDGILKSFICCHGTNDFWVLDLMVSDSDLINLQNILTFCLEYYENKYVKCFYYVFPQKWAKSYKSIWRDNNPTLQKYTIEDIQVIQKLKKEKEEWIWKHILHETIIPMNLLLRKSYVKS